MNRNESASDDQLLQSQRQERILGLLRGQGQVHASALAETFGVSNYTIRRDLDDLAEAGLLERVHGGAVLKSSVPRTYAERQAQSLEEKAQSVQGALSLLRENQLVIVDGGSTAALFVDAIPMHYPATFITHAPSIAAALVSREPADVILIGGRIDPFSRVAVGATTVGAYRGISADLCVLGIWGVNVREGVSSPYYEESLVRAAMVAAADKVVGLAIAEKLGTGGAFTVAPVTALTHLSVESGIDEDLLVPFLNAGVKILQPDQGSLEPPGGVRRKAAQSRPRRR